MIKKLQELKEKRNLSNDELSKYLGLSKDLIDNWLKKTSIPNEYEKEFLNWVFDSEGIK